jgi:hypothetical protein
MKRLTSPREGNVWIELDLVTVIRIHEVEEPAAGQTDTKSILARSPRPWVQASSCSERSSLSEDSREHSIVAARRRIRRVSRLLSVACFTDIYGSPIRS